MSRKLELMDCGFGRTEMDLIRPSAGSAGSLADAIVADLFSNGFGDEATRLVLEVPGNTTGNAGGWCKGAVRDVILKHIKRQ